MFFPPFNEEAARYERKFMVDAMSYHVWSNKSECIRLLFLPFSIPGTLTIFIFDTNEFDFYYDNISGKSSRRKARIRWYGEVQGMIVKPVLEFKIREGMLGNKISFPLQSFQGRRKFKPGTAIRSIQKFRLATMGIGESYFNLNRHCLTDIEENISSVLIKDSD